MEKFTKFDDPSCGLNPFIPLEKSGYKPLTAWKHYLRMFGKVFLILLRLPCLGLALGMYTILHAQKYFLILPILIRLAERFIDMMVCKLVMNVSSFNNIKETYHREATEFDFVKWQKGELEVTKKDGDVYICNQTSFVDWVYLHWHYSPVFTKIVIVKAQGTRKAGLRVLGPLEVILHALGIVFPEEREGQ